MKLWKKIFRKRIEKIKEKREESVEENWEEIVYAKDKVSFQDEEQRKRYIINCLEQMEEAGKELDLLSGEYSLVTSYLTDIDEVESLPEQEKEELIQIAKKLKVLEQEREAYEGKKNRMLDSEYYQIRRQEDEIEEGIVKIKEAEDYRILVKQDLKKLEGERHAYAYRQEELEGIMANLRGMAVIFLTALVLCLGMLLVLQFGFEMDTYIGYFLSIMAGAIAITITSVKYMDADRELMSVQNTSNHLIQLQNKVKIRYVNNRNLLNYFYVKYNTDSSARLEKRWKQFQQEKEERKQYAEAESKIEYYQKQLVLKLKRYRVKSPERWMNQTSALLDKREMVEIRHELIQRRQALRSQLEYNQNIIQAAKQEIEEVKKKYPQYEKEIYQLVRGYSL